MRSLNVAPCGDAFLGDSILNRICELNAYATERTDVPLKSAISRIFRIETMFIILRLSFYIADGEC